MKRVVPQENWPLSWQSSYQYDLLEIYQPDIKGGYGYAYANRLRHTLQLMRKVLAPGAKVLDVAAAQGNFSLWLAENGYEVTWNDLRAELLDYVRLKQESGIIHFAPGDVFQLDFKAYFDAVLLTEMIEHVAHPDDLLSHVATMVKPGGYVIMTTPNGEYFLNKLPKFSQCADPSVFESRQFQPDADGHIFLLHVDEIESLACVAGLKVIETRLFTNPLTAGHLKTEAVLKVLPRCLVDYGERLTSNLPQPLRRKLSFSQAVLLQRPL